MAERSFLDHNLRWGRLDSFEAMLKVRSIFRRQRQEMRFDVMHQLNPVTPAIISISAFIRKFS